MLPQSHTKHCLSQQECSFARKIVVNRMIFTIDLWLPDFSEGKWIHEICDIVIKEPKNVEDIFVVCKTYTSITVNQHYCSYVVEKDSLKNESILINIKKYLSQHQYPVKLHSIGDEFMFRCKRF